MARNRIRWAAIPVSNYGQPDQREMLGTHGSVYVDGESVLTSVLSGEYVSRDNFIRYTIDKYGTPGVVYAIYKGSRPFSIQATPAGMVKCMREK